MSTQGNVLRCFRILDSLKSKQPSYFTDEEIVADNGGGIGQKGEEKNPLGSCSPLRTALELMIILLPTPSSGITSVYHHTQLVLVLRIFN